MSPRMADAPSRPSGFPRVSGDEPVFDGGRDGIYKFSPREWG